MSHVLHTRHLLLFSQFLKVRGLCFLYFANEETKTQFIAFSRSPSLKMSELESTPGLYPEAQSCFLLHSFKNCKPMRQNTIEGICQGNLKPLINCPWMYDLSCLFRGELLGWSHGHLSQLEEDQINNFYSWLQPLT